MHLSSTQLDAYARDGFLVFPNLVSRAEVAALRAEVERLMHLDTDGAVREGSDRKPKSMFRMHETEVRLPPRRSGGCCARRAFSASRARCSATIGSTCTTRK